MDVYRRLARLPEFRAFWAGTLCSRLGGQIFVISITWLVLKATGSGTKIGIALAIYVVGDAAASPLVGVLLDRLPRKPLLMANSALQALLCLALAILFVERLLPFLVLVCFMVVLGAASPLSYIGRMVVLPNLVSDSDWNAANTGMQLNMNLVTLLGPALGGVLIAWVGVAATLWITAFCSLFYTVALLRIPTAGFGAATENAGDKTWLADLVSGWTFVSHVPALLLLVVVTLFFNLTYGPLEPALPVLVSRVFHAGASGLGLLWSSFAIGALVGTVAWGRWQPAWKLRWVVSAIIALWGLCSGAIGFAHNLWFAAALLGLGGLSYAPYGILFANWRMRLVPDAQRGKVFGSMNSVTGIGLPLGQAVGGLLVGGIGAAHAVEIGGVACLALAIVTGALRSAWKSTDDPPAAPGLGA